MSPIYGHSQFIQQDVRAPMYSCSRDTNRYSRQRAVMRGLSTSERPLGTDIQTRNLKWHDDMSNSNQNII